MIFPLGHERTSVRRLPWVTFAIMALCVAAFVGTLPGQKKAERVLAERWEEVLLYYFTHPYLELDARVEQQIYIGRRQEEVEGFREIVRMAGAKPPDAETIRREQARLDAMVEDLYSTPEVSPVHRWAVVPADLDVVSLITYQFMHGGWLHLFGNLFFLYLTGPFIEDVWGRPLFAVFYLGAGALSALLFVVRYPGLEVPLIGASGAIAGVMGAFLIRYWNVRIRFLYWFFFFFVGTFSAPAWIMLPLWFLRELFFAQAMDAVAPGGGDGGVAYWAHVWGFGFGVVVAFVIRRFRVEERFIDSSIESQITLVDNKAVEEAAEAAQRGSWHDARAILLRRLETVPDDVDAATALWNMAAPKGEAAEVATPVLDAIRAAARTGRVDDVVHTWTDLLRHVPDADIEPSLALRMVDPALQTGDREGLELTVEAARSGIDDDTPSAVVARVARVAARLELPVASELARRALSADDLPADTRNELQRIAEARTQGDDTASEGPSTMAGETSSAPAPAAAATAPVASDVFSYDVDRKHTLSIRSATPFRLATDAMTIQADGSRRRLLMSQIHAVAVGGIQRADGRPFLVVDLVLDPLWNERLRLRIVRMSSNEFDPRSVVQADSQLASLRLMIHRLIEYSEALPLPDAEAARGNPFRIFSSLGEYEAEVLAADTGEAPVAAQ